MVDSSNVTGVVENAVNANNVGDVDQATQSGCINNFIG